MSRVDMVELLAVRAADAVAGYDIMLVRGHSLRIDESGSIELGVAVRGQCRELKVEYSLGVVSKNRQKRKKERRR